MGLEDSESRTSPGLVAQEDLSGTRGMPLEGAVRGRLPSQTLSKAFGLWTVWLGGGPDPVHWGDTWGRGPSMPGFM